MAYLVISFGILTNIMIKTLMVFLGFNWMRNGIIGINDKLSPYISRKRSTSEVTYQSKVSYLYNYRITFSEFLHFMINLSFRKCFSFLNFDVVRLFKIAYYSLQRLNCLAFADNGSNYCALSGGPTQWSVFTCFCPLHDNMR